MFPAFFVIVIIVVLSLVAIFIVIHILVVATLVPGIVMLLDEPGKMCHLLAELVHVATELFHLLMQFVQWWGGLIATFDSCSALIHRTLRLLANMQFLTCPHLCCGPLLLFLLHPFLLRRKFSFNLSGALTQSMSKIRQPRLREAFSRLRKCFDSIVFCIECCYRGGNINVVKFLAIILVYKDSNAPAGFRACLWSWLIRRAKMSGSKTWWPER